MEHVRQFFSVSGLMDGFVILLFCNPHPPTPLPPPSPPAKLNKLLKKKFIRICLENLFHPFWELFGFPVELILKWWMKMQVYSCDCC